MDSLTAPRELYEAIDDADPITRLGRIAALNRINALAAIGSAGHGWLGSCFSACELLTALYFHHRIEEVVLSKGHAAAMQYACLVGVGRLAAEQLLTYKDGPAGLQAHTDRETPGILVNTGSLGQALSKTAAIAAVEPGRRLVVILGDGELQEGQCFEGLQTVAHRQLDNLTVVIDRNGYQTARPTGEVKRLDEAALLRALGFEVIELDGHDLGALLPALGRADRGRPRAVVAQTIKGGGSSALAATGAPGQWHGRVPDDELARQVIDEQVAIAALPSLTARWEAARLSERPVATAPSSSSKAEATGRHFSRALTELARARTEVVVLDADLVSPCGLEELESELSPEGRFFEMGIAEQDMVSFAGGLALAGKLPVVNSYASFYKRAVDQVFLNATEAGARLIYAGHYAGLGYHTDGKTHQSLADLALMRAVPAMVVCDPVDRRQTEAMVAWAADEALGAVYFRLRRSGAGLDDEPRIREAHRDARSRGQGPVEAPLVVGEPAHQREGWLIASGPLAARVALDALETLDGWGLLIQSCFGAAVDRGRYRALLAGARRLVTVEETNRTGGLWSFTCELVAELELAGVAIRSVSAEGFGPSFRTLADSQRFHGLTVEEIARAARR